MNVKDIRHIFIEKYKNNEIVNNTLEIIGASFVADENSIFGTPNLDYIEREISWYNKKSKNINTMSGNIPQIWKNIASPQGEINSDYGWCIYSFENYNQYKSVKQELQNNPESRRAIMIYTRPSMHIDYNHNEMNDFICTNSVQYLIRNNCVNAVVQMRSNDAVYGYKNDYAWQKHVLKNLSNDLNIEPGQIHWQVGSLHVYSRHFHLLENI